MIIEKICSGPFQTNSYLLINQHCKNAILIDASLGILDQITKLLEKNQATLIALYLTHSHFDHIADAFEIKKKFDCSVFVHEKDAMNLITPGSDGLRLFAGFENIKGCEPTSAFKDKTKCHFNDVEFEVIHTPGHSFGSCCFYFPKDGLLFSGDTLFKGTIGTLSLATAEPDLMWSSLKKLEVLPKETKVYPGHGSSTTIGQENWLNNAQEIFGE
jgi:glyoxylase-like metal-dependent hydrolase (beta-lactamase superfamily II)